MCTNGLSDKMEDRKGTIPRYCFTLMYIYTILTKVYHFDDEEAWSRLTFTSKIKEIEINWVTGMLLHSLSMDKYLVPTVNKKSSSIVNLPVYLIVISILTIVLIIQFVNLWFLLSMAAKRQNSISKNRIKMKNTTDSSSSSSSSKRTNTNLKIK